MQLPPMGLLTISCHCILKLETNDLRDEQYDRPVLEIITNHQTYKKTLWVVVFH